MLILVGEKTKRLYFALYDELIQLGKDAPDAEKLAAGAVRHMLENGLNRESRHALIQRDGSERKYNYQYYSSFGGKCK